MIAFRFARLRFFLEILHFDAFLLQALQSQLQRAANQLILIAFIMLSLPENERFLSISFKSTW